MTTTCLMACEMVGVVMRTASASTMLGAVARSVVVPGHGMPVGREFVEQQREATAFGPAPAQSLLPPPKRGLLSLPGLVAPAANVVGVAALVKAARAAGGEQRVGQSHQQPVGCAPAPGRDGADQRPDDARDE